MSNGETVSALDITSAEETAAHARWPLLAAAISASILVALFWRTALSMFTIWSESRTFSHGFLIIPIFFWLMWVRRDRIDSLQMRPNFWGLPVITALGCGWFVANLAEIRMLQQFALVGMVVAVVWTVLGTDFVRAFRFPLAFLIFCVPFGESAVGALQDVTAWFAVAALKLSNIPVIRENRTITVPSGVWEVAEACSGIRYMVSSLVLGLVYAASVYRSTFRRLVFIMACLAVPIVANGIRAYGIIMLGYLWGNELASGVAHIIYGLVFFTVVEFSLLFFGLRWREQPVTRTYRSDSGTLETDSTTKPALIVAVCAIVLIGWMPAAAQREWVRSSTAEAPSKFSQPPIVRAPWTPVAMYDSRWQPALRADQGASQSYVKGSERVDLYFAAYSGAHELQLVNGYNRVSDPGFWFDEPGPVSQVTINGQSLSVPEWLLRSPSVQRADWIFYWVDGQFTANPRRVKYLLARARLLGRSPAAAVIALSSDFSDDPSEAETAVKDFLSHSSM